MNTIGLIDDGKIPNLAIMKASIWAKDKGFRVFLTHIDRPYFPVRVDKVFCSIIYTKNKQKAEALQSLYNIEIGGTGWDIKKVLPVEIERCKPDYNLYTVEEILARNNKGIGKLETKRNKAKEIVGSGIGFTSRGCINECSFCFVPVKEGKLKQESEIKDLINPKSNKLILLDNNFTADPHCLDKLKEIRERGLTVDLTQGIDVRIITEEKAKGLSSIRHMRSIHYAWDLVEAERTVLRGIGILSKFIKKYKHMCYMLTGYNTNFEQDMYRFRRLTEIGVDPFVMVYNSKNDALLKHFARWVNGRFYKTVDWSDYTPYKNAVKAGLVA
ncbi:MAG: radical SAM protein [Clostridia bacterium]